MAEASGPSDRHRGMTSGDTLLTHITSLQVFVSNNRRYVFLRNWSRQDFQSRDIPRNEVDINAAQLTTDSLGLCPSRSEEAKVEVEPSLGEIGWGKDFPRVIPLPRYVDDQANFDSTVGVTHGSFLPIIHRQRRHTTGWACRPSAFGLPRKL